MCGLPGCVMYAKRTIFDLLLPRLLADDPITAEDIARLGEGGLCLGLPLIHIYSADAFTTKHQDAIYFSKRVSRAVPDGGFIEAHTDLVQKLDYECELLSLIHILGQIGVYTGWVSDIAAGTKAAITPMDWAAMVLLCFVLPAVLSVIFCEIERKLGWIKEGDLKLN